MARRCSCFICAICVTVAMGMKAKAVQQEGTLQVIPVWCGEPVAEGMVSVSRVGIKAEDKIILTDGLADWYVDEATLHSEDWISWLSQHTDENKRTAAVTPARGAIFENLETGIYLVEQTAHGTNYMPFRSFLQEIPENGQWNLSICPKLISSGEPPKTADRPAPIIGAMGIGFSAAFLMVLVDNRKK